MYGPRRWLWIAIRIASVTVPCLPPNLHIASLLADRPSLQLILTGGTLCPGVLLLADHLAERALQGLCSDRFFLGNGTIDCEAGLTEFNLEEALVKRAMVRSAAL